jgi:hypothetical protein
MLPVELQNKILNAFYKQFPNSNAYIARHAVGEGFYISFRLGKPNEWPNGIAQNDPLSAIMHYWADEDTITVESSLFCKPKHPSHYGSTFAFRKVTIKQPSNNLDKLEKFFTKLHLKIFELKDEWRPNDATLIASKLSTN